MSTFISHLEGIVSPDLATLGVIAVLCAIASYAIKEYLAHPPMIIFVYPGMIFCGLTAYYLFVVTEQFNTKKLDQWLMWAILASICGTVIGIILVSLLAAFREKVGSRRPTPVPRPTRATR
jgi:Na+/phosphate symporter